MDRTPPAWFWSLLDDARPKLQKLVASLEKLPRDRLIAYADIFDDAMMEVCEPWDGPEVDGITFSEDDTADFAEWVVSEGPALWARAAEAEDLTELVRRYWKKAEGWDRSVENEAYRGFQSCRGVATAVFERIYGGDLADVLEELHSRRD